MHLGFAMVETGLTRAKNSVNILFKNTAIPAIGLLTYTIIGFNLMYPAFEDGEGYLKFAGFLIPSLDAIGDPSLVTPGGYALDMTTWADFIFQAMFAATAATIVSGAVAERVKLSFPEGWLEAHPLTGVALKQEESYLRDFGYELAIKEA